MALVFVGEDHDLDRKVVIKILPPELAASVSAERFRSALAVTSAGADGVEEACVADLGGVLREFDIDPCDNVTERTVQERPSCSLCRSQVVVGDLLKYHSPLSL